MPILAKLPICMMMALIVSGCHSINFAINERYLKGNSYTENSDSSGWQHTARKEYLGTLSLLDENGKATASMEVERKNGEIRFLKALDDNGINRSSYGIDIDRKNKAIKFGIRWEF